MEGNTLSQVKRINLPIVGNLPGLCQSGNNFTLFVIQAQALKYIVKDGLCIRGGRLPRVKAVWLRPNIDSHGFGLACGPLCLRGAGSGNR